MRLARDQKLVIASTTLDMMLEGIFVTLPSISALWPFVGPSSIPLVLLTVPIGTLIGNLTLGRVADLVGRKRAYIAMLLIYAIGATLVVTSNSLSWLLSGLLVAQVAIGGEVPIVLSYIVESAPLELREVLVVLITNVGNAGAALAAGIAYATGTISVATERAWLAGLIVAAIGILAFTRSMVPESLPWSSVPAKARGHMQVVGSGMGVLVIMLVAMGISSVLTFGYLALDVGPALFPSISNKLIFLYFAGELVGGLVAAALVGRLGSKKFVLASFLGGLATSIAAIPAVELGNVGAFMAVLAINGVFTETVWASRNVLESTTFPTSSRATGISVVRLVPYLIWSAILYPMLSLSPEAYLTFASALWALGAAAGIAWYFRGIEVIGMPLLMLPEDLRRALRSRVRS